MKKHLAIAALAALLAGNAAAADGWIPVAVTDSGSSAIRRGSFEVRTERETRNYVATAIYRYISSRDNKVSFLRIGITSTDCNRGYGQLNYYDMRTNDWVLSNDYVREGETVASYMADTLCGLAPQRINGAD